MIVVLVEELDGRLMETSREALTFARENAQALAEAQSLSAGAPSGDGGPGGELVAVLVVEPERDSSTLAEAVARLGATRVLAARVEGGYGAQAWAEALGRVLERLDVVDAGPKAGAAAGAGHVILAAGTPRGTELMAHLAAATGGDMAANVVAVGDRLGDASGESTAESGGLLVERQVHGGHVLETMVLRGSPAFLTVAGHACEPSEVSPDHVPEVTDVLVELTPRARSTQVVRVEEKEEDDTAGLTRARAVVGAGRGVGSEHGFDEVLELVDLLGGALGVSRVVTSLGWRPHAEQVGQTGSRISPEVYIACGISGAIQHWAGVQGAKTIVAVNTDDQAPMVTRADYAVIGDLHEVVAAVNEEIRKRRG